MKNHEAPCKACANRCVGCHGTCAKYAQFKVMRTAWLEKAHTARRIASEVYAIHHHK